MSDVKLLYKTDGGTIYELGSDVHVGPDQPDNGKMWCLPNLGLYVDENGKWRSVLQPKFAECGNLIIPNAHLVRSVISKDCDLQLPDMEPGDEIHIIAYNEAGEDVMITIPESYCIVNKSDNVHKIPSDSHIEINVIFDGKNKHIIVL